MLHDALLAAARADRLEFDDEANRRWLTGVLRRHSAFLARTAVRRRQREADAVSDEPKVGVSQLATPTDPVADAWATLELAALPRSARSVLALALHGLRRKEICEVLGLSSTAFRQRLVTLRKELGRLPKELQREALALAYARHQARADDFALGLIRRALLSRMKVAPGVGTHDPDGHLLVLRTET